SQEKFFQELFDS
nr:Chain B, PEROXIN-19 [Homo sapiens]